MANEREFPKIDGDILYASEINSFMGGLFPLVSGINPSVTTTNIMTNLNVKNFLMQGNSDGEVTLHQGGFPSTGSATQTGFNTPIPNLKNGYDINFTNNTGYGIVATGGSPGSGTYAQFDLGATYNLNYILISGLGIIADKGVNSGSALVSAVHNTGGSPIRYIRCNVYANEKRATCTIKVSPDLTNFYKIGNYSADSSLNADNAKVVFGEVVPIFSGVTFNISGNIPTIMPNSTFAPLGSVYLFSTSGTNLTLFEYRGMAI